jgi:LacI family transcriptional regulator
MAGGHSKSKSKPPTFGPQPVTLKMLAKHLGLSPAAVSLVINDSPAAQSIPQKTQDRIRAAARELGYRPNQLARSLRSRRSHTVAVLLPEISEGYAATVLAGIDAHLIREGYFYLVAAHRTTPQLLDNYFQMFVDRLVEGFLLVNTMLPDPPSLPCVAVAGHKALPGVTNVVIDNDKAALLALQHLLEQGHRRIAFFKGHKKSSDTEPRWQAISRAARTLGLDILPELVLQLEGESSGERFTPEQAYEEGHAYGRKLLERKYAFTALFAFNDVSAIGAMKAFRQAGLRIPDDLSVVGFDDIQSAAFQNPGLTTVRQPLYEMGEIAARSLLARMAGQPPVPEITVSPLLVVRESTGPVPASAPTSRSRQAVTAD